MHDVESLSDEFLNLKEPSIRPFLSINQQQQSEQQQPPPPPVQQLAVTINSPIVSPLSPGSPPLTTIHPTTPVLITSSSSSLLSTKTSSQVQQQTKSVVVDYYEVNKVDLHHRVALWLIADILLLTPIREG